MELYTDALSPVLDIRRLLAAMLERAILDLEMNVACKEYEWFRDAIIWFRGTSGESEGFTYLEVLSVLSFTPPQIKRIKERIQKGAELHNHILEERLKLTPAFVKSTKYINKIVNEK